MVHESSTKFGQDTGKILPLALVSLFAPEFFIGIQCKAGKCFSIICDVVWFCIMVKLAHIFFYIKAEAPITFGLAIIIMVVCLFWCVVIEYYKLHGFF